MEKAPRDILLNPTRFRIAQLLNPHERSASEIAEELNVSLKLASFHLQKMARYGIIQGDYEQRTVQNRPFLIRYFSLTEKGRGFLRRIKEEIDV